MAHDDNRQHERQELCSVTVARHGEGRLVYIFMPGLVSIGCPLDLIH